MASKLMTLLCLMLLFSLSPSSSSADSYNEEDDYLETFVYAGCSQFKYPPGSSYELGVDSVLSSVANSAAFSSYSKCSSSPSVSGLFQCRGDLAAPDCETCIRSALSQIGAVCPSATGAALQLRGCLIRYGNDSFLGRPDTSLLVKKCGDPDGGASSGMRDAALGQLQAAAAASTFREAAAGDVRAVAQCDGDLAARDCADCAAAAVGRLQTACGGGAVSGEVYLGKCYARYWSQGGLYGYHSGAGGGNGGGNDAGKTWAIVIGIMAGVAIIVVFVSTIRRRNASGK